MLVWPLKAIGFLFNITQRGKVSYQRIEGTFVSGITCTKTPEFPLDGIENGRLQYDMIALPLKMRKH